MITSTRGSGFSLIELLFSVALLATGFLLVLGVFPASFRGVHQGKHRLLGTQLAQSYMDQERSKAFNLMTSGLQEDLYTLVVNGVPSATSYRTQVTVTPAGAALAASNRATITVATSWVQQEVTGQDAARSVILDSVRTRSY